MLRHIFIQYPFQMVARITLIVKMLTEDNGLLPVLLPLKCIYFQIK